ncbi:MAG: sigma-70 family RNA polymerase sigma factor [Candidatus Acidiferrales bacterium]
MKARTNEPDEQHLVEAAQKDPSRFAELYENNFERVYAFVASRIYDRDVAQDITAEVFHHALANLGKFEWRGVPFSAWLFRIAANAIMDRRKRVAREQGKPALEAEAADAGDQEVVERRAALFGLVSQLPEDQRRVLEMRFAEERSIREIARELGRSEGAIKQLQFRAVQTLRARVSESND